MYRYIWIASVACAALHADEPYPPPYSSPHYDADLFNKDKSVFFASGDFLYWLVNESANDYAIKMNETAWSSTTDTFAIGNYSTAKFSWSPGFRIAVGHFNAPHYWDVFAQYTYVPSFGENTANAPKAAGEYLNGTWAQPDLGTVAGVSLQRAHSRIDMRYHVFDLLVTRRFHTNEHLRFNVFGGMTSGFIYQKWDVYYTDTLDAHSHIRNRWQFDGVGLRLGVKIDWYMGSCDLYLTGMTSAGILSGWYKNTAYQTTNAVIAGADDSKPIRDSHYHDSRLVYTAQFLTGPSWQKRFKRIRAEVIVGYELTVWSNLHEVYRSSFASPTAAKETFINGSNVSLQGFTVHGNIDF